MSYLLIKPEEKFIQELPKEEVVILEETELLVDIKGEVINPGVYQLNENSIINDVISIAGGLTEDADTTNINLSKMITNEMVIYIHSKEEIVSNEYFEEEIYIETKSNLININIASINELMTLSGIGESKANDIIEYRNINGNFKSIDEIKNVSGIGDSTYAKIKDYITI